MLSGRFTSKQEIMKQKRKYENYRFNKGFWDLLYLYSLEYDSDSSEIKDYYTSLCRFLTMPGAKFHPKHIDAIDSIIESH
jgi:hypothetical protein